MAAGTAFIVDKLAPFCLIPGSYLSVT